jgi:Na+/phosphate symporter
MPGLELIGRWLLLLGIALAVIGGLIWLLARWFPSLSQFPGTLRFQMGGLTCVFPLLASIVLSVLLTLLLNVLARFLNH